MEDYTFIIISINKYNKLETHHEYRIIETADSQEFAKQSIIDEFKNRNLPVFSIKLINS
jgi:hypothetical protein